MCSSDLPLSAVLAGVTLERLFSNSKLFWGVCIGLSLYGFMYLGAGMENDSRVLVKLDLLRHGPALAETTTEKVHRFLNAKLTGDDVVLLVRSEEHTSELQSQAYLVCRLLLEKKKYRGVRRSRKTG